MQALTGILIAAGMGMRMGEFTQTRPKCLLSVMGRPLLDWTLDNFRRSRCETIVAVVGHRAETINRCGLIKITNNDHRNNNILHSMMFAMDYLNGPTLVSYSDIWVEPPVFDQLLTTPGDIVLVVDMDWRPYYLDRTNHPISEAEKAHVDATGRVVKIGKHLPEEPEEGLQCGEFIGLWRMSTTGSALWVSHFKRLNETLLVTAPFGHASEWRKAYATDMIQDLIDNGTEVKAAVIQRGWAELDTTQDYRRLPSIASRQRLRTLGDWSSW